MSRTPVSSSGGDAGVIRIKPYSYIHVLDNNTGVTRVVEGPKTFTKQVNILLFFLVCDYCFVLMFRSNFLLNFFLSFSLFFLPKRNMRKL